MISAFYWDEKGKKENGTGRERERERKREKEGERESVSETFAIVEQPAKKDINWGFQ